MCHKFLAVIILLIAIILGCLVAFVPVAGADSIVAKIMQFFEVLIPVLGVGALLKYLFCCPKPPCNTP